MKSLNGFVKALRIAGRKLDKAFPDERRQPSAEYRLVDVAAARRAGVLPIPFQGREKFVDYDFTEYYKSLAEDDSKE